jgi:hypothetical protein
MRAMALRVYMMETPLAVVHAWHWFCDLSLLKVMIDLFIDYCLKVKH